MARMVSEGESVRVTVPQNTTVVEGNLAMFDGWFGVAMQAVVNGAGITAPLILDIEDNEYETSQILTTDAFAIGALVYWDDTNKRLTTTATGNTLVGKVTVAKDVNNVVWFKRLQLG